MSVLAVQSARVSALMTSRTKELIGEGPACSGFLYDENTDSWVRPWNKETIPASEKPEWERYKDEASIRMP